MQVDLPVFGALLIALSAVLSLVTIISIYREGGILKRLRATPLRPHTILTAHVLVKLLFTAVTLALMMLAGRRYYPVDADVPAGQLRAGAAVRTLTHPVDRIPDRQPRADRALRAADRRAASSIRWWRCPGCSCRSTRCRRSLQAVVARCCRSPTRCRCCEGIWNGDAWSAHARRRRRAGGRVRRLHGAVGAGVPLGIDGAGLGCGVSGRVRATPALTSPSEQLAIHRTARTPSASGSPIARIANGMNATTASRVTASTIIAEARHGLATASAISGSSAREGRYRRAGRWGSACRWCGEAMSPGCRWRLLSS